MKSIHHTSFDLDTFKNDTFKKCHFFTNQEQENLTLLFLLIDSHSQCTLFKFSYLSRFSKIWRSHNIRMKYIATKFSQNLLISRGRYMSAPDFRSTWKNAVPFSQNVRFLTFRSTLQNVWNATDWSTYICMYLEQPS